jgi:threonine dehydrogenase-like Zn-dependent dehydrogenase
MIITSRVSHGEFSGVIEALDNGTLNPGKMITGVLKLENAQKGFELLLEEPGKHLKILLKI